jgi:hypothetical protein
MSVPGAKRGILLPQSIAPKMTCVLSVARNATKNRLVQVKDKGVGEIFFIPVPSQGE